MGFSGSRLETYRRIVTNGVFRVIIMRKGKRMMAAKFEAGVIRSWKVSENSFPADLPLASSSAIASECEAKAVEVQS